MSGTLPVRGAKNSVLKAQAASILFKKELRLNNAPLIEDVFRMNNLLEDLGVKIDRIAKRSFKFIPPREFKTALDYEISKSFRSSIVLTGPILAREGVVSFPHPGGCVIGQRPIDVFLDAFKKMGAVVKRGKRVYVIEAKKMKPAEIFLKTPSVTATETLMMTAVLVKGKTVLYNCACEPEIEALAGFLNKAGADIRGAGTHTVSVHGGELLSSGVFDTPPDRIEAGSFAIISALCGKDLKITQCEPRQIRAVLESLRATGVAVEEGRNYILLNARAAFRPITLKTREYPGFPTDLQAPFSIILTQAKGRSLIFETVFEGRLNYLSDIQRMGAEIILCDPRRATIDGPTLLRGREMESPDLRAGLAFLTAGMVAKGDSVIHNVYNIDRGYENIEERLNAVGADIKRVN